MNGLFYRMQNSVARFLYGRNGMDQLGWATLAAELILSLVTPLARVRGLWMLLRFVSLALTALFLFRFLSRNLLRRRAENAAFLRLWTPVRTGFRDARQRWGDKNHKYVKCGCGVWCRVPRNVGKVELMCPKCGAKKIVKT